MSHLPTARRRADAFQAAVEDPSTAVGGARYADLLDVVAVLREAPEPVARPAFVGELRSRLMAAAEVALTPETPAEIAARRPTPPRTRRERRVAVLVGGFAIVTASASMSVAAQSALPGDTLYPLKRAIENVQTGVTRGDESRAASLLDNASGRLAEVDELSRADDLDAAAIEQTLRDFVDQATEAADLLLGDYAETGSDASIDELRDFTASSMAIVEDLESVLPPESRATLAEVAELIRDIDREAVEACPLCGDALPAVTSALSEAGETVEPLLSSLPDRIAPAPPTGATSGQTRPAGPARPTLPERQPSAPAPLPTQPSVEPSLPPGGSAGSAGSSGSSGALSAGEPDVLPDPPLLPENGGSGSSTTQSGGEDDGGGRRGNQGSSNPLGGVIDGQNGDIDLGGVVEDGSGVVGGLVGDGQG